MHPIHPAVEKLRRGGRTAARGLAVAACTLMLAGCYTAQERATPADFDYRLRHNIAIKEGPRTVELFIGSNRGGLNGEQRADVLAFANAWRREATGGTSTCLLGRGMRPLRPRRCTRCAPFSSLPECRRRPSLSIPTVQWIRAGLRP